jgi:membrane-associated phospholipid phosphatase
MKHLPSTVLAGLLASVVAASVAPAFAAPSDDAKPQCGDDKKDKSDETKPKSPSGL